VAFSVGAILCRPELWRVLCITMIGSFAKWWLVIVPCMHARDVRGSWLKWQEWLRDESAMSVTNISCRTLGGP
jgi:hypothetical protein